MSLKAYLSYPFAKLIVYQNSKWKNNAVNCQKKTMLKLVDKAKNTLFGIDHSFSQIKNYSDFKKKHTC